MQKYTDVVTSARSGAAIPNARVTVKTYPGAVLATIYSDDGITTQDNPITTDSNGEFSFYAADGRYQLTVSGTGITERTVSDVLLADPDDGTEEQAAADVTFTPSGIQSANRQSRTVSEKLLEIISITDAKNDDGTQIDPDNLDNLTGLDAVLTDVSAGRAIFVPAGNYKCSAALSIANKLGLRIYGERNSRITFTDGAYTGLTVASTSSRVLIENLEFYGTSSTSSTLTLLGIDAPYCKVRECAFVNADTMISLGPSAVTYIAKIHNNDFAGYDKAITMGTGSGTWNVDYDISGNTFGTAQAGSTSPVVEIQDGAGIRLRGNYFEIQVDNKLSVHCISGRYSINGNDFVDSGGILAAGNGTICGNNFTECATRDTVIIDITGAEHVVSGNFLNESSVIANSIGIRCSSSNNTLTPNFVDRFATGWYISGDDNTIGGGAYTCTKGIEFASGGIRNDYGGLKLRNNTTDVTDPNAGDANFAYQPVATFIRGDAAATLTPRQTAVTNIWNSALNADRAVTLSTTGAILGSRFEIRRTSAATGDFKLTVGTGPLATLAAGEWCDVVYNGSAWILDRRSVLGREAVSADKGDAAATLTVGVSEKTQVWSTTLTADRAVALNTGAARTGDEFHITRPAGGAFNLNVGTGPLKALAAGEWCVVKFNGSAWYLDKHGSL